LRLLLGVGVLGGFTTFSAFSLDAVRLLETGQTGAALGYVAASVVGSILLTAAGLLLVRMA
jgi:CrcB protein